jgi:predicted transcriptional regulator
MPAEELLELLGDEYTRRVLAALIDQPRTGRELIDATGASKATVYRRLDSLQEAGFVESVTKLDPDGHHCSKFFAVVDQVDFEFGPGGFDVTLETDQVVTRGARAGEQVADD